MTEEISPMMLDALVRRLPPRERRGSRPRCVLLTHGPRHHVAERLSALCVPEMPIHSSDLWVPGGFDDSREVTLGDCPHDLLDDLKQRDLASWWLATRGRLPTWDLVSTVRAGGKKGLLLVEAKAHELELFSSSPRVASTSNERSIRRALEEATTSLNEVLPGWDLQNAPYQLANRIAWAWKLASLGVPTVLTYLGFLHATEMRDRSDWFFSSAFWRDTVHRYSAVGVPSDAWGTRLRIGDAWLQLEIRSMHVPLPHPCPSCGGQLRWIVYGFPTEEANRAAREGRVVLGGCLVMDGQPTHECERCLVRRKQD